MKFTFCWLLSAFSISLISCAEIKAQTTPKNSTNEVDKCPKDNSFPVCGTNGVENLLFGNECLLKEAGQKRGGSAFTKTTLKSCFQDCDLICLGYYDPICAINQVNNKTRTFNNKCEIVKDSCSTETDWQFKRKGKCLKKIKKLKRFNTEAPPKKKKERKRKPIPCPKIFNPVCAIYTGVKSTFINECLVNAENVNTGKDWKIFSQGICEEDYSSVSKSPKRHAIEKRSLDLKEFGSFGNIFEVGGPVTLIRPPTIFHTHFVKNDETENIFNKPANNPRAPYDNQAAEKSDFLLKSENMFLHQFLKNVNEFKSMPNFAGNKHINKHAQQLPSPLRAKEQGFQAVIAMDNYEPPQPYYPEHSNMQIQPALAPPVNDRFDAGGCKLGNTELCCSFQNKKRTFKNICDLNLHNELTGEEWQLEHEGSCDHCSFKCSKLFQPLCVSMNGLQYTLANECILNAAICKHGDREWRIIKNGVCDEDSEKEYQQVKDKYATVAPGFRYTSKYSQPESTTTTQAPDLTTVTPSYTPDILQQYTEEKSTLKTLETSESVESNLNTTSSQAPPLQIEQKTIISSTTPSLLLERTNVSAKKSNSQNSKTNAENEYIFFVKPLKKPSKMDKSKKSFKHKENLKENKDKDLQELANFSTTPKDLVEHLDDERKSREGIKNMHNPTDGSSEAGSENPLIESSSEDTFSTAEKRLSMYGSNGGAIMTALLKALDKSSKNRMTSSLRKCSFST